MLTPREYLSKLEILTDEYSKLNEYWVSLMKLQADFFGNHREEYKSDATCQRAFDRTEDGIRLLTAKTKLKSKEKQISTIKTAMRLLENESKNLM